MPSTKPLIALRLDEPLYNSVVARAKLLDRTPANLIAHELRKLYAGDRIAPRQVDLETAIADAVKRGPVKTASKHK